VFVYVYHCGALLVMRVFVEALVVTRELEQTKIQNTLEEIHCTIKLDYATIPDDGDSGTADTLRYIKDKIQVRYGKQLAEA